MGDLWSASVWDTQLGTKLSVLSLTTVAPATSAPTNHQGLNSKRASRKIQNQEPKDDVRYPETLVAEICKDPGNRKRKAVRARRGPWENSSVWVFLHLPNQESQIRRTSGLCSWKEDGVPLPVLFLVGWGVTLQPIHWSSQSIHQH